MHGRWTLALALGTLLCACTPRSQSEYLRRVQALVSSEHAALTKAGHPPTDDEVAQALTRIRTTLEREHPEHTFAVFLKMGLPTEWRRVVQRDSK
jgi:hypothetical protein